MLDPEQPQRQNAAQAVATVESNWLALTIGNSRLHWAWFSDEILKCCWDTPYQREETAKALMQVWNTGYIWSDESGVSDVPLERASDKPLPLWIASVVPEQLEIWRTYSAVRAIALEDVPLQGLYPSLGIDRALAVLGAGTELGWPVLAIDAGTALTFTGADDRQRLVGGAILPGFGLQLKSLCEKTAALPAIELPSQLPVRWALETPGAIQSGIAYTIVAGVRDFIQDWWQRFPESPVAIAGGGGEVLLKYLETQAPEIAARAIAAPPLIFWGIRNVRALGYPQQTPRP